MTDPNSVPPTNPAPVDTPPAQPPAQQPPVQSSPRPPVVVQHDNSSVLNAVNALPERLVDAVRELLPQSAPTPPAQQQTQTPQPQTPPATPPAAPAKRRSAGEWFFGVNKR